MNSFQFTDLFKNLGEKHLPKTDFIFKNDGWHHLNNDYQLSFILGKDNNSPYFNVKYLSVILRHTNINPGKSKFKPYISYDKGSPIQISPLYLKKYVKSDFNSRIWHYTNAYRKPRPSKVYAPIYYGGKKRKFFISKISESHAYRKNQIELFGAKYITENQATKELEKAIVDFSKYGIKWSEHMNPINILAQLEQYNDDWWVEKNWIEAYRVYLSQNKIE